MPYVLTSSQTIYLANLDGAINRVTSQISERIGFYCDRKEADIKISAYMASQKYGRVLSRSWDYRHGLQMGISKVEYKYRLYINIWIFKYLKQKLNMDYQCGLKM